MKLSSKIAESQELAAELTAESAEERRLCQLAIEAATPASQPTLSVSKMEVPFTVGKAATSLILKGFADIALGETVQEGIDQKQAETILVALLGSLAYREGFPSSIPGEEGKS